jgi:hypothetical protein
VIAQLWMRRVSEGPRTTGVVLRIGKILALKRRLRRALARSGIAGAALFIALACGPMVSSAVAAFGLGKLRVGTSTGSENYLYTTGDVIFPEATPDAGQYYTFTIKDSSGAVQGSVFCTPTGNYSTTSNTYTVQSDDPLSGSSGWSYTINQFSNSLCSGSPAKTAVLYFDVAKATSYSSSSLTTQKSLFGAGATAYVTLDGIGQIKTSPANAAVSDWSATWILPSGANACANTAGGDRPDSTAAGRLPSTGGSFLQYQPTTGDAWNTQANYDASCPAFSSSNDGAWKLKVQKDGTHFVTLPVFTVDGVAPDTTLDSGPSGTTSSTSATFSFSSNEAGATFECKLDSSSFASCSSPKSYSGLSDGSHTFTVRATDTAGNTDATPTTRTWTIDSTAPDTTIDSSPANPSNSATAIFAFSSSESGSTFQCKLDAGSFSSCNSPKIYTTLSEGSHTFSVRATDASGNTDATPATRTWTVDRTAPDTTIDSGPTGTTSSADATFTFSSNEAGATFECKLDSGSFASCSSPQSYIGLSDGSHTFTVRSIDTAGNTDATPATRTWTVATTAPDTMIDSGPSGTTSSSSATFAFSSNDPSATFECKLDAGSFASCSSPKSYTGLSEGSHTFTVRATDGVGNTDQTPATRTWTVDTSAPDTTIDTSPANPSNSTTAIFAFSSSESGSTFECKLDAGGFSSCSSPQSYTGLSDGSHTFTVRAIDTAGNTDATPATRTWTVDTSAPDTTIDSGPSGMTSSTSASFAFSSNDPSASFECRLDSGSFASCTSPKSYTGLSDGSHTFTVRAVDTAGNTDTTPAARTWTVDTAAPDTTIDSGPSGATNSTSAAFTFSSNEAGATFECKLDSGSFASCTSPWSYTGLGTGSHTFTVRAIDPAGNTDATPATRTWTVDTSAPDTTIDSGPSGATNSTDATFTFSSNEAGATFECQLDSGSFASCTSPKSYTGLSDGSHTFTVRAVDAAGNTDATPATRTWTVITVGPNTTIDSGPSGPTSSTSATFTFSSNDPSATFECQLDSGSFASCTSPKTYSSLSEGQHTFSVQATDAAGNTDTSPDTRTWTVDTTRPETSIDSSPPDPTNQTQATFDFSSDDLEATFECKLDSGSFASCSSPKSYTGLSDGSHTFTVRAVDSAGNTDATPATRTWTVDATAPSTTILSGPSPTTNSTSATFTFTSDDPNVTFECQLDSGSFESCSSPRSYSSLSEGSHTFSVRATDGASNTDPSPDTRTWTIDTTAPETTIDSGPSGTTSSNGATFEFSSNDPSATFECRLDSGSFVSCSSPRTYSSLADGEHTLSVRASDALGNTDATPATRAWTVDTNAPETFIDSTPDDPTSQTSATFEFSSDEPGTTFQCRLDSGSFESCSSPQTYNGLSEGSHTFRVRATDQSGNTDATPDSATWKVDTTAPETTIVSGPNPTTGATEATFAFSSSEQDSSFECRLDSGSFESCSSPQTYSSLSEGSHTFSVRATDTAANTDPTPATRTWTIQQTGTIVVIKDTRPDNPQDFHFTAGGGLSPTSFTLDDDADGTLPNMHTFNNVTPGSGYSISETVPSAWQQASATCNDGSPVSNIDVSSGETVTCTFVNAQLGYARPLSATPVTLRLVPAFETCTASNSTHSAPLALASCNPPVQSSTYLTMNSPDRPPPNNTAAGGTGSIILTLTCLAPGTTNETGQVPPCPATGDQMDMKITSGLADIRCAATSGGCAAAGGLYSGKVMALMPLQITDRLNGPAETGPGTLDEYPFKWGVQCTSGACNSVTSADSVIPGIVREGKRAVWALGQPQVLDGGSDGDLVAAPSPASGTCPPACEGNGGETVFLRQGLFTP